MKVFDEGIIKGVSLTNRFVRSATWEELAIDKSFCSPELITCWKSGDKRASSCISDNLCYRPIREGKRVYCLTKKRETVKK